MPLIYLPRTLWFWLSNNLMHDKDAELKNTPRIANYRAIMLSSYFRFCSLALVVCVIYTVDDAC